MKETEEDTIPCVVSDPGLNVTLYERPGRTPVTGTTYEPGRGFTGRLNDTSYVCLAARGDEERESQVYYVFSIVGEQVRPGQTRPDQVRPGQIRSENCLSLSPVCLSPPICLSPHLPVCLSPPACLPVPKAMEVDLTVSSSVLKQGEVLTVNCTVKDAEMVFFSWDYPRRQVPVSLSIRLSVWTMMMF